MKSYLSEIQQALTKYDLELSEDLVCKFLDDIQLAQQYFPICEQRALIIKLLVEWESNKAKKIHTVTSEACHIRGGLCVTTFGILSIDWPGLSDTCIGVIHEMGWNIYFVKGISIERHGENIGIILIGVRTDADDDHDQITGQIDIILQKIHQAAVGTSAKTYLLSEEIRKLEIYSQVIALIEQYYQGEDLEKIIGMHGEAVKYFAARSRDYIENRKNEDIADQIIRNYTFVKNSKDSGGTIQLHISNFVTAREGAFTGVTIAGPAQLVHLEDCLKTIELTIPNFKLKHNREFTTEQGISVFRIEFVDSTGQPLTELEHSRLEKAFSTMVLNKQRDRAQWIDSIGGFEQYARAIIPLLVRETESTGNPQVYHAVGNMTDLVMNFKVIIVVPLSDNLKKIVNNTINQLEAVSSFHIQSVKPPKTFGKTDVFIIDLRVNLADIENTEKIHSLIKEKIFSALGDFRDFDEGMRTIDTSKMKAVRQRLEDIDKYLLRELYYAIEDFFRVSASTEEIVDHIRLTIDMLETLNKDGKDFHMIHRRAGQHTQSGKIIPRATLLCVAYPHRNYLLQKILEILEPYEVTLSRLERSGWDILTCWITKEEKALKKQEVDTLLKNLRPLGKMKKQEPTP